MRRDPDNLSRESRARRQKRNGEVLAALLSIGPGVSAGGGEALEARLLRLVASARAETATRLGSPALAVGRFPWYRPAQMESRSDSHVDQVLEKSWGSER